MAMTNVNAAQADVTIFLNMEGVIRDITLSNAFSEGETDNWIGRPWVETIADPGDQASHMVEQARASGVSAFHQVTQRFPSGLKLPMEYTIVRLGEQAGLIAIGKNLQAVTELQSRLVEAQRVMERDYWKLREVETRYRLLFDASNDAVLLVNAASLRVVEANPAAIRALGIASAGREFLLELTPQQREPFQTMLLRVREHGKAPATLVHIGQARKPWLVRASLMTSEPGLVFLLQFAPVGAALPDADRSFEFSSEALLERMPDGFVILDRDDLIVHANRALVDMVEGGAKHAVVGQHLGRWLGRPGADLNVLLANVREYGSARLFATVVHGELGTESEVEISAAGDAEVEPRYIGLVLRNVGRRLPAASCDDLGAVLLDALSAPIGKTTLQKLVKDTIAVIERHYVNTALERTDGNRTAAAELLGLSRQSLYAKLARYGLDDDAGDSGSR